MNLLSMVMGLADFFCIGLVVFAWGYTWFTLLLMIIMIPKAGMSFM